MNPKRSDQTHRAAAFALAIIAAAFALLSLVVAVRTPAFEANDEVDHVRNVETIVGGGWYRLAPGSGREAHQPPLYYLALAGWQKAVGPEARIPEPERGEGPFCTRGCFAHDTRRDSADQRLVLLLRLPSVALGLATVLLTAAVARRVTRDPWTPVVAAGIVAGVPRFVFLSGVVNNDSLATALGGAVLFLSIGLLVSEPANRSHQVAAAAAIGGLLGLLVITKVSTLPMFAAVGVTVAMAAKSARRRVWTLALVTTAALAVCGWWLAWNQARYGDPLARRATLDYLRPIHGLGRFPIESTADQIFVEVPRVIYRSFWYTSGHNQFRWDDHSYIVFWMALLLPIVALFVASKRRPRPPTRVLAVLSSFAMSGLAAVWIVGLDTTTVQARVGFFGLPAIGCLAALGLERWKVPVLLRFVGPALGLIGVLIAIRRDIIGVYG